jgi:hypothetical protein
MNQISPLFGSWFACAQTVIFSAEPCSKNAERQELFFGLRLMRKEFQHPQSKPKESSTLVDIFIK